MELFTTFFSYYLRRLQPIWWQVVLITLVLWFPGCLLREYITAQHFFPDLEYTDAGEMRTFRSWYRFATGTIDLWVWPLGMCLIFNLLSREEKRRAQERLAVDQEAETLPNPTEPGFGELVKRSFRLYPRMVLTRLCVNLVVAVGTLFLLVPGLFFYVRLCCAQVVLAREKVSFTQAMRRSWYLVRGRFWLVCLLGLMAGILSMSIYLPILGVLILALGFFEAVQEPAFWPVHSLLLLPLQLVTGLGAGWIWCVYDFLLWAEQQAEPVPVREFLFSDLPPQTFPPGSGPDLPTPQPA